MLRVITSMDPASGGPCQGIRNSIPALNKLGVYTEVVCLDAPNTSFLHKDSFPVHAIGPAKGPWAHSKALIPWLVSHFENFDIVIAHGLWLYQTHAVRKALQIYRKQNTGKKAPRFYVMPHGMLDPYFQKASGRKLKALRNLAYWKLIESKVVNGADGVLFTCQAELELARQPFTPYAPKKELNVGYGIPAPPIFNEDMNLAFQACCPLLKDRNYFLFLSRVHEKKGVDILINAYKKTLAAYPEMPCLVIAGPGLETAFGKQLFALVENEVQLTSKVFFAGMLTGNAKWGAFFGCDAFVLPSHQENFGIAVVEALACTKPVLISNQVNIWHEIETCNGGFVANDTEAGTIELFRKWNSLTPFERKSMELNAKQTYEQFFAVDPAASRMFKSLKANS
ncbi:hypothetical protein BH10BAC3_BH10BAC3_32510 [soil metagenome]